MRRRENVRGRRCGGSAPTALRRTQARRGSVVQSCLARDLIAHGRRGRRKWRRETPRAKAVDGASAQGRIRRPVRAAFFRPFAGARKIGNERSERMTLNDAANHGAPPARSTRKSRTCSPISYRSSGSTPEACPPLMACAIWFRFPASLASSRHFSTLGVGTVCSLCPSAAAHVHGTHCSFRERLVTAAWRRHAHRACISKPCHARRARGRRTAGSAARRAAPSRSSYPAPSRPQCPIPPAWPPPSAWVAPR